MRAWEVENSLAVLLERLPAEDLGEQVRRVLVGRDVLDRDDPSNPEARKQPFCE